MITPNISDLLGIECHLLAEGGNVALIDTPFAFQDGDSIPVFVEQLGGQLRFFDDGGTIIHLMGRGVSFQDQRKTRFIKALAEPSGVALTDLGELEIWSSVEDAPVAFGRFIEAMLALARWEHDQIGVGTDLSLLVDEVALCLRTLRPNSALLECPEYTGVSGYVYKLDFNIDNEAVMAVSTHHSSVSSAAKKLLDIRGASENADLKVIVVLDDRYDKETAKREARILESVANVWMFSRLENEAGIGRAMN